MVQKGGDKVRRKKPREVVSLPQNLGFRPISDYEGKELVILTVDEYEAIRLIDKEGVSQEECGAYMNISRATVQRIYAAARKKIALSLVEGLPLQIEGGDYQLKSVIE
jgi:predicted DNA-binding protein (UPF0251 family)